MRGATFISAPLTASRTDANLAAIAGTAGGRHSSQAESEAQRQGRHWRL